MPRPRFAALTLLRNTLGSLFRVFRQQRIFPAYVVAVMAVFLAVLFAFLSFSPVLSPFIYPLF
jgi:hypothetical protein